MSLLGRLHFTDYRVALFGVAISIFSIAFLLIRGLSQVYLFPAFLTLGACGSWLLIRRANLEETHPFSSRTTHLALGTIFFVLLAISFLSLQYRENTYERPLLFFILTALMAGVIAAQIPLSSRRSVPFILGQTIILAAVFVWSQNMLFPNVLYLDPWVHQWFTNKLIVFGYVPGNFGYSDLPFYHLLMGQNMIISSIDFKTAQVAFAMVRILVQMALVFYIARMLFNNHKAALFAALATTFATWVLGNSLAPTPSVLGFTFVLIALYFLVRNERIITAGMMVFFTFVIVWTHTVASVAMIVILVTGFIASRVRWGSLISKEKFSSIYQIAFFIAVMLGWWSIATFPQTKLAQLIQFGFSRDVFSKGAPVVTVIPVAETLFNLAGIYIFYAVAFIGVLYFMSNRGTVKGATVATVGVALLGIAFFALVSQLGLLQDRWFFYSQLLLAIPLGMAIYLLFNLTSRKRRSVNKARKVLPLLMVSFIAAALTFLAILNPLANIDNTTFSPNSTVRNAYTVSELTGASFVSVQPNVTIATDYDFGVNPSSGVLVNFFKVDGRTVRSLDTAYKDDLWFSNGTLDLVRTWNADHPFDVAGGAIILDYNLTHSLDASDLNGVYANGGLSIYT